jgi:hypothetical protein
VAKSILFVKSSRLRYPNVDSKENVGSLESVVGRVVVEGSKLLASHSVV